MKKMIIALFLMLLSSSAFAELAENCSQLPNEGKVSFSFKLADGREGVFKATLDKELVDGLGQLATSHTYYSPRVFVDGREVAVTGNALDLIAKQMGYLNLGYRLVQGNFGYFKKRHMLVLQDDEKLVLQAAKDDDNTMVLSPNGYGKFFHPECADWQF